MAAGLAVISTDEGAIAEIVEAGVTGEVLSDCTPELLAQAMMKHLDDPEYSRLCARYSQEKFFRKYTSKIFEEELVLTLQSLAK